MIRKERSVQLLLAVFLLVESVLYYLILTTGGDVLVVSSFLSIVVSFLYSLMGA